MQRLAFILFLLPFSQIFAQQLPLYNGAEYTAFYRNVDGHPFFKADSLLNGEVFYDGMLFTNVMAGYNMMDDELYIRHPESGYNIRLIRDKLDWFSIAGHRFVKIDNTFYELLYNGHVRAFARRVKKLKQQFHAEDPSKFVEYNSYFIQTKGSFYRLNGINSFSKALPDKSADIKKWIREYKLNFSSNPESTITAIADMYEKSIQWTTIADTLASASINKKSLLHDSPIVKQRPANRTENPQVIKSPEENRLIQIGNNKNTLNKGKVSLAGYIKDATNGEAIIGATVSADASSSGIITDQFGYYSLTLPKGRHVISISAAGMKATKRQVTIYEHGKLDIELQEMVTSLKTVLVVAEKNSNVRNPQMSVDKLTIKTIRQVPVVFGETDVLRVLMTLPGVTSAGEASTGFNVRGGSVDQNLILLNEATIYNPSHLFGFFSAFNPDMVKGVELYKSAIPQKYGGRLSSVLDVTVREGNNKKISGTGGIGPLTSKLTIEGPIKNEKTTFIAGARTTYSDWLLKSLPDKNYRNSRASFYDLSLNISHTVNSRNSIYLTGYLSNDRFRLNNDTSYQYGNRNANIKWKHIFNNKFHGVLTAGTDQYNYSLNSNSNPIHGFRLKFDVNQTHFRTNFIYSPDNKHSVDFGLNSILYKINPGSYIPYSQGSLVIPQTLQTEQALETAIYIGDKYMITPDLTLNAGLRYSVFNYLGPQNVYMYAPGIPKDTSTIVGSVAYRKGNVIKTYQAPEYRISARYSLSENSSLKVSFNTTRQYIHMLSNTTIVSPTDTWKLSDRDIKPQQAYQVSAGFYKDFKTNSIETSVEIYYKRMEHMLDYKSGARLILNSHIAADVINAKGKSYGAEFMLKRTSGKLNGWISYTYSRTLLQQHDPIAGETINNGKYYPAGFDKPHNMNVIANYRFTHRVSISANSVYTTGRPVTIPIAIYNLGGAERVYYSDRNQFRIPDYFRVDVSMTIEGNHNIRQKSHNSWSFGVYNLTARKNPYSVYFIQQEGVIKGYQLSIFGTIIPFVTYNFKF